MHFGRRIVHRQVVGRRRQSRARPRCRPSSGRSPAAAASTCSGGLGDGAGLKVGTGVKVVSGCCGTIAPGTGVCAGFFRLLRGDVRRIEAGVAGAEAAGAAVSRRRADARRGERARWGKCVDRRRFPCTGLRLPGRRKRGGVAGLPCSDGCNRSPPGPALLEPARVVGEVCAAAGKADEATSAAAAMTARCGARQQRLKGELSHQRRAASATIRVTSEAAKANHRRGA